MNTFNGFCIAACMFMVFVGMASTVVSTLGVFPSTLDINTDDAQSKFDVQYNNILSAGVYGATILGAIALAFLTRTTNLIGMWIFSGVFWAGWLSVNGLFYTGGFLNNATGIAIVAMLWFGMTIMFIGAVTGILSGSTVMR
jgi:hypothetical protein